MSASAAPLILFLKGGPGSGFFGHSGRPGRRGGSAKQRVREFQFSGPAATPLQLYRTDSEIKAHPDYRAAKAGDADAAIRLVRDLAIPLLRRVHADIPPGALYVAPHAVEATGENAIPMALAAAAAEAGRGELEEEIVQSSRVFHTGADPMERLAARPEFDGSVRSGARYVLVDDVTTMGGTLAELADYITRHGGQVSGVVVLVNAARSGRLVPEKRTVAELERRHGGDIKDIFGISPRALTAEEAQYLIGFRSADEIRSRKSKAEQETPRRKDARGV